MASPCSFCYAKGEFKLLLLHSKRMREMVQRREACQETANGHVTFRNGHKQHRHLLMSVSPIKRVVYGVAKTCASACPSPSVCLVFLALGTPRPNASCLRIPPSLAGPCSTQKGFFHCSTTGTGFTKHTHTNLLSTITGFRIVLAQSSSHAQHSAHLTRSREGYARVY